MTVSRCMLVAGILVIAMNLFSLNGRACGHQGPDYEVMYFECCAHTVWCNVPNADTKYRFGTEVERTTATHLNCRRCVGWCFDYGGMYDRVIFRDCNLA